MRLVSLKARILFGATLWTIGHFVITVIFLSEERFRRAPASRDGTGFGGNGRTRGAVHVRRISASEARHVAYRSVAQPLRGRAQRR